MSNAGRCQQLTDWNLAFQNGQSKQVLGSGIGTTLGWSPRYGDFMLERAYLQGDDFLLVSATGEPFFEVEKNNSTTLYDLSYTPAGGTGAAELHIETDDAKHVITASDYITADLGHRNYTSGTLISKDVGCALEGRYLTGPLAGQYVTIGRRGIVRGFHITGAMNGLTYVFNFLGVTDAMYAGGTGWQDPTDYKGWPVPVPMTLRRIAMYGTVNNPVAFPDDNDLVLRIYVDDPTKGTPDGECLQSLNVGFGAPFTRQDLSIANANVDVGNEVFLILQQVRNAGTGSANLIDLSVILEWEVL